VHYGPTDRRTDGRTDEASYRDAWTHLKIPPLSRHLAVCPGMSFSSLKFDKLLRHCVGKRAQNDTKPRSWRENGQEAIRAAILNTKAQKLPCNLFCWSHLPNTMSPTPCYVDNTTLCRQYHTMSPMPRYVDNATRCRQYHAMSTIPCYVDDTMRDVDKSVVLYRVMYCRQYHAMSSIPRYVANTTQCRQYHTMSPMPCYVDNTTLCRQ